MKKAKSSILGELMFVADAALIAKSSAELPTLVNAFADAAKVFGLTVNVKLK